MIKAKKYLLWFLMLGKRLLCKKTFVALLCLIPLFVPVTHSILLNSKSSILEIALCNPDNDPVTAEITDKLTSEQNIISYTVVTSPEEAKQLVKSGKADGAWIFTPELGKNTSRAVSGIFKIPLVSVVEREDTVPLMLSREVLYGAMYNALSYSIFEDFIFEDMQLKGKVNETTLKNYYTNEKRLGDIVEIKPLNSDLNPVEANILTAPLRGLVALLVVVCTFAAMLYFLKDRKEGRFSWLSPANRIMPALGGCLAAAVLSGITVFVTLQLSGISTGFFRELLSMLFFITATTGFCLVFCAVFSSPTVPGALLPGIAIGMLLAAPVFFEFPGLEFIKLLSPLNYYIYSLYDTSRFSGFAIYCVSVYSVAFAINHIKSRYTLN